MAQTVDSLQDAVRSIVGTWKPQRAERQARRSLDPADFVELRDAGWLRAVVPEAMGGLWRDARSSARGVCEVLRLLATADPSVALVSSMHPSVVSFWLLNPDPQQPEWEQQRQAVFASAESGEQWGTITSEPGSGGDIGRTRATATPVDAESFMSGRAYAITGDKHFGSGLGIADRMVTTAIPEGEDDADDVRARRACPALGRQRGPDVDRRVGRCGHGRHAEPRHAARSGAGCAPGSTGSTERRHRQVLGRSSRRLFTAVILGVVDEAVAVAKQQLVPKVGGPARLRASRVDTSDQDHWLAVQALEGSLRAIERRRSGRPLRGALVRRKRWPSWRKPPCSSHEGARWWRLLPR